MSSAAVNNTTNNTLTEKPHHSAFSAVVRKSFSSFSVDSILASPPADARPVRSEGDLRTVISTVDTAHLTSDLLLHDDTSSNDRVTPREDISSPRRDCDDEDDDEEDIHVDSEPEDQKDEDHRGSLVRPTALGPGTLHAPPPILPHLWPSLPLLQHQLSLRALTSKIFVLK